MRPTRQLLTLNGDRLRRHRLRAFTLVELMIVVAIIGILAAIAIYGVSRYLGAAKSAEGQLHVGALSRAAHAAFEREYGITEGLVEGTSSVQFQHQLCDSAAPVPGAVPAGRKYQPTTDDLSDFGTGDEVTGWKCLRFRITEPIHYQYNYWKDVSNVAPASPTACGAGCYEAGALGDLDGDTTTFSRIARTGKINPATGGLLASTYVYIEVEAD
jgi:type IV pilus assembly protein PilA